MPDKPYTVLQVVGRTIIDAAGNPVPGYHIDFVTGKGMKGYVDIPAAQYSPERAKQEITAEAKRLDDMLLL